MNKNNLTINIDSNKIKELSNDADLGYYIRNLYYNNDSNLPNYDDVLKEFNNKPLPEELTKEDVTHRYKEHARLKDLRKLVDETKDLDENTPILVERVHDYYYEKGHWGVLYLDGEYSNEYPDDKNFKDQFHPAWYVGLNYEKDLILVYLHY